MREHNCAARQGYLITFRNLWPSKLQPLVSEEGMLMRPKKGRKWADGRKQWRAFGAEKNARSTNQLRFSSQHSNLSRRIAPVRAISPSAGAINRSGRTWRIGTRLSCAELWIVFRHTAIQMHMPRFPWVSVSRTETGSFSVVTQAVGAWLCDEGEGSV